MWRTQTLLPIRSLIQKKFFETVLIFYSCLLLRSIPSPRLTKDFVRTVQYIHVMYTKITGLTIVNSKEIQFKRNSSKLFWFFIRVIQRIIFSTYYERMAALMYVPVLKFNENNTTLLLSFVPRSSTGLYLQVPYSAKVLHIVNELCENTIRLGTNYKMCRTQ